MQYIVLKGTDYRGHLNPNKEIITDVNLFSKSLRRANVVEISSSPCHGFSLITEQHVLKGGVETMVLYSHVNRQILQKMLGNIEEDTIVHVMLFAFNLH